MLRFFSSIRKSLLNEGKTVKYVKYAVGEFLLIVAGILMALQIQNWNEERVLQAVIDDHLEALAEDFRQNLDRINESIEYVGKQKENAVLLRKILRGDGEIKNKQRLSYMFLQTFAIHAISASTKAYDELLNTGNMSKIGDRKLRSALGVWKEALDTASRINSDNLGHRDNVVWFYLIDYTALSPLIASWDGMEELELERGKFTNDFDALANDRRIDNLISSRLLLTTALQRSYEDLREATLEVDRLIAFELAN